MRTYSIEIQNKPIYCKEPIIKRFYSMQASSYAVASHRAINRYVKEEKLRDSVERGFTMTVRRDS